MPGQGQGRRRVPGQHHVSARNALRQSLRRVGEHLAAALLRSASPSVRRPAPAGRPGSRGVDGVQRRQSGGQVPRQRELVRHPSRGASTATRRWRHATGLRTGGHHTRAPRRTAVAVAAVTSDGSPASSPATMNTSAARPRRRLGGRDDRFGAEPPASPTAWRRPFGGTAPRRTQITERGGPGAQFVESALVDRGPSSAPARRPSTPPAAGRRGRRRSASVSSRSTAAGWRSRRRPGQHPAHLPDDVVDAVGAGRLGVEPQQRLGVGGAQVEPDAEPAGRRPPSRRPAGRPKPSGRQRISAPRRHAGHPPR